MPKTPMLRVRNGKANKDALQRQPYVCSNGTFGVSAGRVGRYPTPCASARAIKLSRLVLFVRKLGS